MILYPLIRAARIASACAIVSPEYQLPVATLTELLSSAMPLLNTKLPLSSYIIPFMNDPYQTLFLIYSYNRLSYERIELFSLILLLLNNYYYYK
tara:strand:+ start:362 stop:643 length:282 start_codon:yes stop_codon:yes gene_type:complete